MMIMIADLQFFSSFQKAVVVGNRLPQADQAAAAQSALPSDYRAAR